MQETFSILQTIFEFAIFPYSWRFFKFKNIFSSSFFQISEHCFISRMFFQTPKVFSYLIIFFSYQTCFQTPEDFSYLIIFFNFQTLFLICEHFSISCTFLKIVKKIVTILQAGRPMKGATGLPNSCKPSKKNQTAAGFNCFSQWRSRCI